MHLKRSDLVGANCPFVRHERPAVGLLPQQPAAEPREPAHLMRMVIRGHQRSSEVIRGHQRSSEVIRGYHQRSSEVSRRAK